MVHQKPELIASHNKLERTMTSRVSSGVLRYARNAPSYRVGNLLKRHLRRGRERERTQYTRYQTTDRKYSGIAYALLFLLFLLHRASTFSRVTK